MRNLVRLAVTVAFLTASTTGLLWEATQPVHETRIDEVALFIEEHGDILQSPIPEHVREGGGIDLIHGIIASEMLRLGVIKPGFKNTEDTIKRFLEFIKLIESNGDPYAKASTSSAMSLFQFTKGSVPTAVNRLENYMARQYLGPVPSWAESLRAEPTSLFSVPEKQQAILALVNIIEQRGSDDLLRAFLSGEREAAKAIYYTHHHTDPDEATVRRTERIFAKVFR